jgi:hypothetical protein
MPRFVQEKDLVKGGSSYRWACVSRVSENIKLLRRVICYAGNYSIEGHTMTHPVDTMTSTGRSVRRFLHEYFIWRTVSA